MSVKLPTIEELEELYHRKGHEALIWYSWRNTLRTLPLLGRFLSSKTPKNNIIYRNMYAVSSIAVILANVSKGMKYYLDNTSIAEYSLNTFNFSHGIKRFSYSSNIQAVIDVSESAYSACVSKNTVQIIKAANHTASYASYAAWTSEDSRVFRSLRSKEINYAARSDYNFLLETNKSLSEYWFTEFLWNKEFVGFHEEERFDKLLLQFLDKLCVIGLDFLACDINKIYLSNVDVKFLPDYWVNYLKAPSDVVLASSGSLRQFILQETGLVNAVRVIILGPGGAGKTTLADRLRGNKEVKSQNSTLGIDFLDNKPLELNSQKGAFSGVKIPDDKLELFLWDFGGQALFHGLHNAFLHENCIYILVVDSRHEQAPDEWLHQIRHLSKSKEAPPVIVITNIYENCEKPPNKNRLENLYGSKLLFYEFPCNKPEDIELKKFKQKLLNVAEGQRREISISVLNAGKSLKKILCNSPVIAASRLYEHLEENLKKYDITDALRQLEGLGYLIPLGDKKRNYCLSPSWTIDHAYQFLKLPCVIKNNGKVIHLDFDKEALQLSKSIRKKKSSSQLLDDANRDRLIEFLQHNGICAELKDEKSLFFPDAASSDEPKEYIGLVTNQRASVELILPFLPIGLAARLVNHWLCGGVNIRIKKTKHIWREGFVLSHTLDQKSFLIIRYYYRRAVVGIDCFGKLSYVIELLEEFWSVFYKKASPIDKHKIISLFRVMDHSILIEKRYSAKAVRWLENAENIEKTFRDAEKKDYKIAEISEVTKYKNREIDVLKRENEKLCEVIKEARMIKIKGGVYNSQLATGGNVYQNQTDIKLFSISNEKKLLILDAVADVHAQYAKEMNSQHRQKLLKIEQQAEQDQVNEKLFSKLTASANVASIASAITGLIGLFI